jgi:hypothetical protein
MMFSKPAGNEPALEGIIFIKVGSNRFKMMFLKPAGIEPVFEGSDLNALTIQ